MDAELVSPLLKGCITGQLHGLFAYTWHSFSIDMKNINNKLPPHLLKQPLQSYLFLTSICATASLGTFEILTQKLKNGNGGESLPLYQEAFCGFISGSTAVLLRTPFEVASKRIQIHTFTYTNWFTTLHQILLKEGASTLWRGHGLYMSTHIASYTGILASTTGAGTISSRPDASLTTVHTSVAVLYLDSLLQLVLIQYTMWEVLQGKCKWQMRRLHYSRILPCIRMLVTPYSGSNFYNNFLYRFRHGTTFCMVQYAIHEEVRRMWSGPKKQE